MKKRPVFYYTDEVNDEVIDDKISPTKIDRTYKYVNNNFFYKVWAWITYRIFATPLAFVYFKLIRRVKFINKYKIKEFKHQGFFIYANHTNQFCDGFCPHLICFPQKPHIICNPANLSMPVVGKFNKMCGAIPTPTSQTISSYK